ncbi:MAG: type II toxin-antitoxin system HicB family antitoxin [Oscillospiraceae bacterium]
MAKYVYPAIFTEDEDGYSVRFPDVDGCFTSGRSLQEALEMAEDALCLMPYDMGGKRRSDPGGVRRE